MKIFFLGTGAADYKPCHRDLPGYRRNSSALVNGELLIDPGPCVPEALEHFGKDPGSVRFILNTHRHKDHFNPDTVSFLEKNGATFITLEDGESKQLGNLCVTALKGNHSTRVQHLLISDAEKTLFYGLDSSWLLYEEIQALKKGVDLAVLDCTVGFTSGDYRIFEHCSADMILTMASALREYVKRICISHMARTLHTDHETLAAQMGKHGIEVAFDGLELDI